MTFSTALKVIVDLMDELKRKDVFTRRLALALSICCAATAGSVQAADVSPAKATSLRHLLKQGWGALPPVAPPESDLADSVLRKWPSAIRQEAEIVAAESSDDLSKKVQDDKSTTVPSPVKKDSPTRSSSVLAELIRGSEATRAILPKAPQPVAAERSAASVMVPAAPATVEFEPEGSDQKTSDETPDPLRDVASGDSLADYLRAQRQLNQPAPQRNASQEKPETDLTPPSTFAAPSRKPLPTYADVIAREANDHLIVQSHRRC